MVRISLYEQDGADSFVCKIRFRGLAEGESFITVTTASLKTAENEDVTAQTRSVKVKVVPAEEKPAQEESAEEQPAEPETAEGDGAEEQDGDAMESSLQNFLKGLSAVEFLVYCLCLTVILLLLVLLGAERGKRKGK